MFLRKLLPPSCLGLTLGLAAVIPARAADATKPIPGIGPAGPTVKLHTGFQYTDGIAPDRHGNIYFSDIPAQRVYKVDREGRLSVFREKSNHTNGLRVNSRGEVVMCEMDGRVAASPDGKKVQAVADRYEGKRFNAPNDLIIDRGAGVYFSDPTILAPTPLPQGKPAVYYAAPGGKVTRLIDDLTDPNGVCLSPDERTLYVIPTGPADMMAYPVKGPGRLGPGRVFCTLRGRDGKKGTGGDGMTIDSKGNLYITSELGVQVFNPSGRFLGVLAFPEQPANVAFGGADRKTLYVTARTSLYTVPMEVRGHVFPAGGE